MTREFAFNTKRDAEEAGGVVTLEMFKVAISEGFAVVEDRQGNPIGVVGKVNGVDAPQNQLTTRFAVPVESVDGKWVLPDVEGVNVIRDAYRKSNIKRTDFLKKLTKATERDRKPLKETATLRGGR